MFTIRYPSACLLPLIISIIFSVLVLQGCKKTPEPLPEPPSKPATPSPSTSVPTPITEKSVVFNNIEKLIDKFSLEKTMNKIIETSVSPTTPSTMPSTTAAQMLKIMLESLRESSFIHPESGKTIKVDARPLEPNIKPENLLDPESEDGMIPVGLFNRFDLAPADGSDCGEYRIVYAKKSGAINGLNRMTMIFEAKAPNPYPGKGIAGCAPITDFWAARSADTSVEQTISELEKFYYQGIPGVPAVVHAKNFGIPLGQLRVNLFVRENTNALWALREFLVGINHEGEPIFKPEPVDDSPSSFLFQAAAGLPPEFSEADMNEFRSSFLGQSLCNLVNPDRAKANASAADIINGITAGFISKYNDFESISQGDADNPATDTDPELLKKVQARLISLEDLKGVLPEHLMNRAGTMTCGGCHQFSNEKDLSIDGAKWPSSLRFVHINESGQLSPLLNEVFIPRRVQIAQQFKENRAPFQQEAMPCLGEAPVKKSLTISDVTKPREHAIYKNVDILHDQILQVIQEPGEQAEKSDKLKTMLPELNQAIDETRKQEMAPKGPYIPSRTH